jgi:hypothetical protein
MRGAWRVHPLRGLLNLACVLSVLFVAASMLRWTGTDDSSHHEISVTRAVERHHSALMDHARGNKKRLKILRDAQRREADEAIRAAAPNSTAASPPAAAG